jgi:hypothetical protein
MCGASREEAKYSVGCAERGFMGDERGNVYEGKRYVVN